jgi:Uma2 family endonuclease
MSIPTKIGHEVKHEPFYPSGDGEPMAETPIHVLAIILLYEAIQDFFRDRPDIYIASNMFWYWEEGNPAARRAPDVMVIPGVSRADRRSFFSWKENGTVPAVIFEIASEKTWQENLEEKRREYERLGVKEYFVFDPEAVYVRPPLRGFRLAKEAYRAVKAAADGHLASKQLGLHLKAEGRMLRLSDAETGEQVLTREERIAQERQRVQDLEAEVARLRALLDRTKNGDAK